jgi:hypothetical protein
MVRSGISGAGCGSHRTPARNARGCPFSGVYGGVGVARVGNTDGAARRDRGGMVSHDDDNHDDDDNPNGLFFSTPVEFVKRSTFGWSLNPKRFLLHSVTIFFFTTTHTQGNISGGKTTGGQIEHGVRVVVVVVVVVAFSALWNGAPHLGAKASQLGCHIPRCGTERIIEE